MATLVAAALSGCMGPADPGGPGAPAAPAETVESVDCLSPGLRYFNELGLSEPVDSETVAAPEPGTVPDGFVAAEATLCAIAMGEEIDETMTSAIKQTSYAGDLTSLVAAINMPSDPRSNGPCTMEFEFVPELFVIAETGEAIRAAWPVNGCGKTKPGIREALADLEIVDEQLLPVQSAQSGDPFASCLSQLPPDGQVMTEAPEPVEGLPAEPIPGETSVPDFAADAECG